MRPLSLQISGLNSFRKPVAIDFDKLIKDGLFGIFGPTGSGKSTILDAITLALYGKVRRAPEGTQGIINMGEQRCSVSFRFSIGENGSRRDCTIERLLARNARTNGVETKKVRLAVYRDGVLEKIGEKNNELKEMVNDIVGINVEDFLRAVVLPQGAFADFLTLKAKDRSAVLQRLFGLYQLGDQLNQLLKQHAQELQEAHAQIQGRLQDLRAYDDDALALCHDLVRDAERVQAQAREALGSIEARHGEAAALYALIAEYRALMESEEERGNEGVRLQMIHERIELAERSLALGPSLTVVANTRARLADARESHQRAMRESEAARDRLAGARERYQKAEATYRDRHDALCDEINELKQMKQGEDDLTAKRHALRAADDELSEITGAFERQSTLRDQARAVVARLENELGAIDRQIEQWTLSADERRVLNQLQLSILEQKNLQEEIDQRAKEATTLASAIDAAARALESARNEERACELEATAARDELATLKGRLAAEGALREELLAHHAKLKEPLAQIELYEKNLIAYEAELRAQSGKLAGARAMREREMVLLKEAQSHESAAHTERGEIVRLRDEANRRLALASLAGGLHIGDRCPLCGSLDHPAPFHGDGAATAELESVDRELARVEKRLRETEERRRQIEGAVARSESALEHLELDLEEREKKVNATRDAIGDALRGIDAADPVSNLKELRERIETVTAKGVAAKRSIGELSVAIESHEKHAAAADTARGKVVENRARLDADLIARRNRHAELELLVAELRGRLERARAMFAEHSNGRSLDAAGEALRQMQENDRRIEELRAGTRDRQASLNDGRLRLNELDDLLTRITSRRAGKEGERRNLETDIVAIAGRLEGRMAELLPEAEWARPIGELIGDRERSRDRIRHDYEESKALHDAANTEAQVAHDRAETFRNTLSREEKELDEAVGARDRLLEQNGFASATEAEAGMLAPADLKAHREEARAIAEALERARRRQAELRDAIAGRDISTSEMEMLAAELGAAKNAAEEAIRALGAAQEKLRECREKNVEWKNVSRQDLFSAEGKATADQLAKYLRGNGFIDFLANERLAEICRRASMQLDKLTAGRFELDARPNEGFIIRDNGNGGGERSPSSLSGGETFLVSLSLAIALSDTIQLGHSPLEFFFLDEGFGTLDSDLLETVMNTLDRLRSNQRAIGVISHVGQLRERISRRLIVSPANEIEGSSVRYEMA